MINIEDLKGGSALSLLESYVGINPLLIKLRNKYLKDKKLALTDNQSRYIIENHDREPMYLNRVVGITEYLGLELQKQAELSFTPQKVLIEFMLADTEKAFHVYGKLKQNQKESKMYWLAKTQVLEDPYFIPLNIDVDFTQYNNILDETGKKLYAHQEEAVKFLLSRNGCVLGLDMGLGKVLANDTKVLTPNGWVENGSLKINDYVIGSNGKPTKITGVYPQPEKNYYNITFTDGTIVESCDEHLWAVQTTTQKTRNKGFVVKELKEIMNDLTYGTKGNVKWYIPIVKPINYKKKDLKIDPYVLGCILGDGGITTKNIIFSSKDIEIINEINNRLPENHILKYKDRVDYRLNSNNKENLIIKELKTLGLMGSNSSNKFIPNEYIFSSIEDRNELLQGLLDTDGYCGKDGTIQFYSISKELINGVKELVQSLGGIAKETSKIGSYKKENGEKIICKECFTLTINLPEEIEGFKLKRKLDRCKTIKKYHPSRGIKKVEFSRRTLGQCISVEAEDKLYVMDQYVVTHNTLTSIVAALESGAKKILIVCPSSTKINWEREINVFSNETTIIDGKIWRDAKFTIINFDILKNFHTTSDTKLKEGELPKRELANASFDLCIVDEAHYLKNNESIRGKVMVELSTKHNVNKFWLLTGTPVANRPMDFFNLLKIIKSPIAENWKHYAVRYCAGKRFFKVLKNGQRKQIWLTDGASNLDELAQKTKNIILRRMKTDVIDMPDKVITPMYYQLDKKGLIEYDKLWDDYMLKRKQEKKRNIESQKDLVELILLRQFIAAQSIPYTIELAENAIEMGRKVIIFTNFTEELELLTNHFGKAAVRHNGVMSTTAKQKSVDAFQNNDKVKVFVGNIKSAGVGITLTEGTVVIFNSFSWVTGENEQSEDRAFRIGQNNDVNVYYQLFSNTISTKMWEMLNRKKDIIATIMGDKKLSDDEITNLIIENL